MYSYKKMVATTKCCCDYFCLTWEIILDQLTKRENKILSLDEAHPWTFKLKALTYLLSTAQELFRSTIFSKRFSLSFLQKRILFKTGTEGFYLQFNQSEQTWCFAFLSWTVVVFCLDCSLLSEQLPSRQSLHHLVSGSSGGVQRVFRGRSTSNTDLVAALIIEGTLV